MNYKHMKVCSAVLMLYMTNFSGIAGAPSHPSINHSKELYTRGHVASPTLQHQTQGFLQVSLHAAPLPIWSLKQTTKVTVLDATCHQGLHFATKTLKNDA